MQKLISYLAMIFISWQFVVGMVIGYVSKAYFGGPIINLVTGIVFGILLFEVLKFIYLR